MNQQCELTYVQVSDVVRSVLNHYREFSSSHSDKESADYSDWLFAACYCILKSMALNWSEVRLWLRFEWWSQFISKFGLEVENE